MSTPNSSGIAFGISSYAYTWALGVPGSLPAVPMTVFELLETADRLGAACLQLADNAPVHTLSREAWRTLMSTARRKNIQLELGIRGLRPEYLRRYLSLAKQCGSPFLRVVIDADGYEPGHDEIVRVIREVLPDFARAGVTLAIENHDRFRAYELATIIEATDRAVVGICLDTANSLGADEGIFEVAEFLGSYTVNLHVKDYRIQRFDHNMGFTVTGCPAGEGQTPLYWLLDKLARTGKCRSATLETWSTPLGSVAATIAREREWSSRGAAHLKATLTEINTQHHNS